MEKAKASNDFEKCIALHKHISAAENKGKKGKKKLEKKQKVNRKILNEHYKTTKLS